MSATRVSAIVVSYNSVGTISACLASLREEARRLPLETWVVDNDSKDDTLATVEREFPEVHRIAMGRNAGFAAGCNRGAVAARGEQLFFLNPDAAVRPLAVVELAAALAREERAAIAAPRIVGADGVVEPSFAPAIGIGGELWQRCLGGLHRCGFAPARAYVDWRSRRPASPAWVSGAAMLVGRDAYRALGGMDERFFLYFEDADLCARVRAAGFEVIYCPRAEVVHTRGASGRSAPLRVQIEYRRSQLHYYEKHAGPEAERLLRLYLGTKFGIAGAMARLGGDLDRADLAREVLGLVGCHRTG